MAVDSLATRTVATDPGARPVRRRRGGGRRRRTWIWNTVAVIFALIMFFPVYWMVVTAFKPSNEVLTFHPNLLPLHATMANFSSAINAPDFLTDMRNSVIITVVSVVLGLIVGSRPDDRRR